MKREGSKKGRERSVGSARGGGKHFCRISNRLEELDPGSQAMQFLLHNAAFEAPPFSFPP